MQDLGNDMLSAFEMPGDQLEAMLDGTVGGESDGAALAAAETEVLPFVRSCPFFLCFSRWRRWLTHSCACVCR